MPYAFYFCRPGKAQMLLDVAVALMWPQQGKTTVIPLKWSKYNIYVLIELNSNLVPCLFLAF